MSQHSSDSEAFDLVTSGFYRVSDPQLTLAATRQFLELLARCPEAQVGSLASLVYLFGRIIQVSDEARALCGPVLERYTGPHAIFASKIRGASEDASFPNALRLPLMGAEVLDLLWAEFFVTGAPEPLLRMISRLDDPDGVRARLTAWLKERSLFGGSKRRAAAALLASRGIIVDLDASAVRTEGDLDCLCYSIAEKKHPIFRELPFNLSQAEISNLAIKGTALWSLRLNASAHPRVAELCRSEATKPGGPARRRLTELPDSASLPFRL